MGCSKDCTIVISEPSVSQRHCSLVRTDNGAAVECLDCAASVLINGRPAQRGSLCPGDELAVGSTVFVLMNHADPESSGINPPSQSDGRLALVGNSSPANALHRSIEETAATPLNVLLMGETGTGKELVARSIHARSNRADKPIVTINCAAIPDNLFESEMFGHTRGAFTGANTVRQGLLQKANGGTLFLDEVGDLARENQARLLRVLEDGTYRPVGSDVERRVDIRVIAATNRHLDTAVFRQDLFHRLSGVIINVPPLRDRAEDIPLLAQHFLDQLAAANPETARRLSEAAGDRLKNYAWPGNVRELRNCIEHAAFTARSDTICKKEIEALLVSRRDGRGSAPVDILSLREVEKRHIKSALEACEGSMAKTARALGIGRSTLYMKVKEYDIAIT